jgi:hypothetical protein
VRRENVAEDLKGGRLETFVAFREAMDEERDILLRQGLRIVLAKTQ